MFARLFSIACAGAAALLTTYAFADAPRPVVVELFTSQGCSSCPPADRYLTELSDSRADVLPLAFHVTYWNQLGWQDPFSLGAADALQTQYVQHFHDFAYTPELVVDGRTAALQLHAKAVTGERLAVLLEAPSGAIVGAARVVDTPDTRSH